MKNVDLEQSVRAIFVLSEDVEYVKAQGTSYVYFKPIRTNDVNIIKYILQINGIKAELHRTHYYNNYNSRCLIVRVHVVDLGDNQEFKMVFNSLYSEKQSLSYGYLLKRKRAPVLFGLWPSMIKARFINKMADQSR